MILRMNLFAELKRRNVIRMAGLYLVGAWLLVQVAGTVLPWFSVSESVLRGLVVMLSIGFVPALVFAWLFELTPTGLKRDADVDPATSIAPLTAQRLNRVFVSVLVLAVAFFCFDRFVLAPRRDAALVAATTRTVKKATIAAARRVDSRTIAVLPFLNMSDDKDNAFFADGISEELLNVLVRVNGLGVASRTSSFAFRGKEVPVSEIANQLKVRYVLEGSVRKQSDTVRITAQLIDASDDRHVWSQTYDRKLTDIFKIQDEIANAIVTAVRGSMPGATTGGAVTVRADTDNMQAYQKYLKARELFIGRKDMAESVRLFDEVTAMDPGFARGWEGQAAAYVVAQGWGVQDRDYIELARVSARRALALNPRLSTPWAVLAQVEVAQRPADWTKALELSQKAIAADSKNATALLWRSIIWTDLGFFDRAEKDQLACLAIDPAYANCERWQATVNLSAGRYDRALALFENGVVRGFRLNRAGSFVPLLVERGDILSAAMLMQDLNIPQEQVPGLIQALRHPEQPGSGIKALIDRHADAGSGSSVDREMTLLWVGDFGPISTNLKVDSDAALVWDPRPVAWRNSAAFKRMLQQLGVPAYWRKHGFPPQCHALAGDDFTCDKAPP